MAHARKTPAIRAAAACAMRREEERARLPPLPEHAFECDLVRPATSGKLELPPSNRTTSKTKFATTSHRGVTSAEVFMTYAIRLAALSLVLAHAAGARAAPEPGLVRLTARTSGRYRSRRRKSLHGLLSREAGPEGRRAWSRRPRIFGTWWIGMGEVEETGDRGQFSRDLG